MLQTLPVEIQLVVINHDLNALDIIHLQRTCKAFNALIDTFAEDIWRNCLQRLCIRDGLWWPSFKDLSTAVEFKETCTRGLRFANACEKWEETHPREEDLDPRSTQLEFGPLLDQEFFLVPGGRYLITFGEACLSIWDLRPLSSDGEKEPGDALHSEPMCLISSHNLRLDWCDKFCYANVVNGEKLQILLSYTTDILLPNTIPNFDEEDWISEFELLEIVLLDPKRTQDCKRPFGVRSVGTLRVVHSSEDRIPLFSIPGDDGIVILHATNGITLAWDSIRNRFSGWQVDSPFAGEADAIFSNTQLVVYVYSEGIQGVKIPEDFRPVNDDHCVLISSCCEDQLGLPIVFPKNPWIFFLPHVKPYGVIAGAAIIGPSHLLPISETRPLIYAVREIDPSLGCTVLRWYQFRYNPTDLGAGSTLTPIQTTPLSYNVDLVPHRYQLYNDRVEVLWRYRGHVLIFIFTNPLQNPVLIDQPSHSHTTTTTPGSESDFHSTPAPTVLAVDRSTFQLLVQYKGDREPTLVDPLPDSNGYLDAATGNAAFLCWDETGTWVELLDLLEH